MNKWKLRQELQGAGAGRSQAREFVEFAATLHGAAPHLSEQRRHAIAAKVGIRQGSFVVPQLAVGGTFAIFVALVLVAQSVGPTSPLYALKRGSEEARVLVQPSFKDELIDRRKHELDDLRHDKSGRDNIERAQKEYEKSLERAGKRNDSGKGGDDTGGGSGKRKDRGDGDNSGRGSDDSDSNSGNDGG